MSKQILIIHTQGAFNTLAGKEALDFSLIFAAYDQSVNVLFLGEGASQCLTSQQAELLNQKDYLSTFKLLEMYEIEGAYVCQDSLEQFGWSEAKIADHFDIIDNDKINQLKAQADHVLVI